MTLIEATGVRPYGVGSRRQKTKGNMKKQILILGSAIGLAVVGCNKADDTTNSSTYSSGTSRTMTEAAGAARPSTMMTSTNALDTNSNSAIQTAPATTDGSSGANRSQGANRTAPIPPTP